MILTHIKNIIIDFFALIYNSKRSRCVFYHDIHKKQKFNGFKRTRRFLSIGSPHKGTLIAQLVPKYPFRGISEMKINSKFLRELAVNDFFLDDIECINFFTYWDLIVFPGWWTNLNLGKKISVKVFKHRNLVRNKSVVDKIIGEIII